MALLYVGIGVCLVIFLFLIFQFILTNTVVRDLDKVKQETQRVAGADGQCIQRVAVGLDQAHGPHS